MAQPPSLPNFEKSRFSAVPLISSFWDLLYTFLKQTVEALRGGLTVRENLAAAWVDIEVSSGTAFPMREMQNPLPAGKPIHGVQVAGVFNPASPGASVGLTAAPFVEWTTGPGGGLVVLDVVGVPASTVTVRVLVFAE